MKLCEKLCERLKHYGNLGYQTVFDEDGINVYYRFCISTEHIYSGHNVAAMMEEIESHCRSVEDGDTTLEAL